MRVVIIGGGPAGLTAGYLLCKNKVEVTVLEADPKHLGGISRTVTHNGFLFDVGGHRFFSKSKAIEDLWKEILPNDLIERPRSSKIYFRKKFFSYPLKAGDALAKLGVGEAILCTASYARSKLFPVRNPRSFQDWVTNQFGHRLFTLFFQHYTEKVWGMKCTEISSDWAAQRIKGLSLGGAIRNAFRSGGKPTTVKTLIESFRYPRRGPGMLWEAAAQKIREMSGTVLQGERMVSLRYEPETGTWAIVHEDGSGTQRTLEAEQVISSAPLRDLVEMISPRLSEEARDAARSLRYRDFLIVGLIFKGREFFEDNWVYVQDPSASVSRIQNFKSWSPEMVPSPEYSSYGFEYFCFEGDEMWSAPDRELIDRATRDARTLGFAGTTDVLDACVIRQKKAYPVYDEGYVARVALVRDELQKSFPSLHLVGRNAMHRYNNQDHSMMTAMLTVQNILLGKRAYDPWRVNEDAEYLEE